ncbi:uncharacterized protein ACRADG_006467 [Cochliomyia hominivorax]
MGRFKIYDANKFVEVLNDKNYAKCLICDKRLKNIMGNIKRHYEQMHSICVDASTPSKKRKSRRKITKNEDDDQEYKVNAKSNKEQKINNNILNEKSKSETKQSYKEPEIISKKAIKGGVTADVNCNNNVIILDSSLKTAPEVKENKIKTEKVVSITNLPHKLSETQLFSNEISCKKVKLNNNEKDISKLNLPPKTMKQQLPLKKSESTQKNNPPKVTSKYLVNNIQVNSFDSYQESFKCFVTAKTHMNIPLKHLQQGFTFQKSLQNVSQDILLNINNQSLGEHMDRLLSIMKQNIIEIAKNRIIYLKLDVASSKEQNIMLVNIQFLKNFEIQFITLSVFELLDEHLASYLKEKVLKILEIYKIDITQVYTITKDNANIVNESLNKEELEMKNALNNHSLDNKYCQHLSEQFPGHLLHFVACDIIKQLNENISQSRDSVKSLLQKMSHHKMECIPILDNNNNWFSVYYMIKSLLDVRDKVENNNFLMVEIDWIFAVKFEQSFRPIINTSLMLQSSDIFIMGDFYREWLLCEIELEELSESNELALYLLQALNKRKVDLFKNPQFLAALYLDPRFCYMGSMHFTDKQKELAMTQLFEIFSKLKSNNLSNNTSNSHNLNNDRYTKLEKKQSHNMAISYKNKMEPLNINDNTPLNVIDSEWLKESLEHLQFGERLPYNTNILSYWKIIKYKNPILAKIAEIALAVPATQATINRALSAWPILRLKHKHNINSDNIENLLLLKLNKNLVDKIVLE